MEILEQRAPKKRINAPRTAGFTKKLHDLCPNYWLVKQEPSVYCWDIFMQEGETAWTGVRNFQARNNLRGMQVGDPVLFYHSVKKPSVVGVATVIKTAFPDPTASEGDWSSVILQANYPLNPPVTLAEIKVDSELQEIALIKQSRLSVMRLKEVEFFRILKLGSSDGIPVLDQL